MEIREQLIDGPKRVARPDEYASLAKAGLDERIPPAFPLFSARGQFLRGILESAYDRGADGENGPVVVPGPTDRLCRGFRNFVALGMNLVPLDLGFVDRLERPQPNVQRNGGRFNSPLAQTFENRGGKMQPGGGRCDAAWALRENRLIAFAVGGLVLTRNVRRQGYVAEPFNRLGELSLRAEANSSQTVLTAIKDFGGEFARAKIDPLPNPNLSPGPNESLPFVSAHLASEKDFNR